MWATLSWAEADACGQNRHDEGAIGGAYWRRLATRRSRAASPDDSKAASPSTSAGSGAGAGGGAVEVEGTGEAIEASSSLSADGVRSAALSLEAALKTASWCFLVLT